MEKGSQAAIRQLRYERVNNNLSPCIRGNKMKILPEVHARGGHHLGCTFTRSEG